MSFSMANYYDASKNGCQECQRPAKAKVIKKREGSMGLLARPDDGHLGIGTLPAVLQAEIVKSSRSA